MVDCLEDPELRTSHLLTVSRTSNLMTVSRIWSSDGAQAIRRDHPKAIRKLPHTGKKLEAAVMEYALPARNQ